jgi:hypothetical protein
MPHPASSAPSRARRPLLLGATLLVVGLALPSGAAAAPGVFKGTGNDAAGDAPSGGLDINGADVVYNQNTGRVKGTIRMSGRPPGDVDVLFGKRQASGACSTELTLNSNVAAGTGELRGSAGNARAKATVSFANNVVTVAATDAAVSKKTIDCATANAYGAGANHTLRDTIKPAFDVTERVADPVDPEDVGGTGDGTDDLSDLPPDDGSDVPGVDTDGDGVPDDFDGDGIPDDLGTFDDGSGLGGDDAAGGTKELSVRVYGAPRRLKRGRSYELRIRIRNDGPADATRLKVRLAKKTGVAMSRRVASVSKVRSGKGITVHVRVRLTSSRAKRTLRITVRGAGVDERRSVVLRRRGAR